MLGEIGDRSVIPVLLELAAAANSQNRMIAWHAIDSILERRP